MKPCFVIVLMILFLCNMNAQEKIKGSFNSSSQIFETEDQSYWINYFENGIAQISSDGYFGFMKKNGNVLCPPKYDRIFPFQEKTAIVCLNNQYGLVGVDGKELIAPSMFFIGDISEDLAWFQMEKNGPWGLLNAQGEIIARNKYQLVTKFQEGYALVVDYEDRLLIISGQDEIIYQEVQSKLKKAWTELFADDLWESSRITNIRRSEKGEKLSRSLPQKTPFQFSDGLALIAKEIGGSVKYGFIDKEGVVIEPNFEEAKNFKDGFAPVKKDGQWGLIDKAAKNIIPNIYQSLEVADDDLFVVSQKDKFGVINKKNKIALPLSYTKVKHLFGCSFAVLKEEASDTPNYPTWVADQEKGKWGVLNAKNGNTILSFGYDNINAINKKFGIVINYQIEEVPALKKDTFAKPFLPGQTTSVPPFKNYKVIQRIQVFNKKGLRSEEVYSLPPNLLATAFLKQKDIHQLKAITPLANNFWIKEKSNPVFFNQKGKTIEKRDKVELLSQRIHRKDLLRKRNEANGLYGMVNNQNEMLIPLDYNQVKIGYSGVIIQKADKFGFMDFKGKTILDLIYDQIEETITAVLKVAKNNEVFLIDKKGSRI